MRVHAIPIEDKFILYRPLRQLAFVGNQAMADLVSRLARQGSDPGAPEAAMTYLETIGFTQPDPPPPPPPDRAYHPTTAVLLLTNRCNLRCTYCYARGGEGPARDLSLELARAAIDHVHQNAVEQGRPDFELTFHGGGEPVRAWETMKAATAYAQGKELPCRTSVVTNGVWSAEQRAWILDNLDNLSISLDGDQETQDRQRPFVSGRGSFKAVMHTIDALDRAGFSYGIRMTATAPWRDRLPKDVRFICEQTGCPSMQVEPAFNVRRGEHRGPTREQGEAFVDAFMEAFEIARQAGRQLTYSGARPWLLTQTFCTAPYGALVVDADGGLVACYEITGKSHTLAELSTVGRVVGQEVVVDHPARDRLLSYLEGKRAACRHCFCYWHCAGDCYTRSRDGRASARCAVNREITARILLWYIMAGDGLWRGQGMHPQDSGLMRTF
jgi:uncharacterized protein